MLLLIVLLAQLASPSGEAPIVPPQELQKLWEDMNLACRRLPFELDEVRLLATGVTLLVCS